MGKRGAESIHAHMMRLERTQQGIANDVDRLKCVIKEHMLELAPSNIFEAPTYKEKKK